MKVLVSCPFGVSALLGNELKRLHFKPFSTFERGTYIETDLEGIYRINLWSRLANKVYIVLEEKKITDFDALFDVVKNLSREEYLGNIDDISIKVSSKGSALHSTRTIQSIAHKAIITSLESSGVTGALQHTSSKNIGNQIPTISLHLENDICTVLVNTSGSALYQRGYRTQVGEAPLKENLAVALLLLSGWKFKFPLVDPFCGSGTILIEAALLAKNIAPGSLRSFAFEQFRDFDPDIWNNLKQQAKDAIFDKEYQLYGYDADFYMMDVVKNNARNFGVEKMIHFEVQDFEDFRTDAEEPYWIVTNPPYGKRLAPENLEELYSSLAQKLEMLRGGVITSFPIFGKYVNENTWVRKQLYNGADVCYFWYRK